jgi:arabinoxylan arabinofuranohydrolase
MPDNKPSSDFFSKALTAVILILVIVNIYTGATIQEIGIPGIFMVKFGEKEEQTETLPSSQYVNPVRIEAENYNEASAHVLVMEGGGVRFLGYLNDGEWTKYDYVNLGSGKIHSITAKVASDDSGGSLEIRLDGPNGKLIGICDIPFTGGWENWQTVSCDTAGDVADFSSIYFVHKGYGTYLYNMDWLDLK